VESVWSGVSEGGPFNDLPRSNVDEWNANGNGVSLNGG